MILFTIFILNGMSCNYFFKICKWISPYHQSFNFIRHMTSDIKPRRRFKSVTSTRNEENADEVLLCHECAVHLTVQDLQDSLLCKNAWPGFFWSVLSNKEIHAEYGEAIWKFIPKQWRYWWLDALKYT